MMKDTRTRTGPRIPVIVAVLAVLLAAPTVLYAQTNPRPEDVASPDAIVDAAYDAVSREPGEDYDWDRVRSLFVPGALMVPNPEQTGGEFMVLTVDEFIELIDGQQAATAPIGSPDDHGFVEAEIHSVTNRYGDVVQVMSTYDKRLHGSDESLGRGVNGFTLVSDGDRWWIVSIAWDEEVGAGPIPSRYMP